MMDRVSPRGALQMVVIAAISIIFLLPLIWMTTSALRAEEDIFRFLNPFGLWTLLPNRVTLDNIAELASGSFPRAIFNSLIVAVVTVVLGLIVCAPAAFALAVIDFPGRGVIFTAMIVSFLIPFDAVAVPLYSIMSGMNLQNTYAGLILPGIGNGLAVFLLRQFFQGIPKDLREAAMVDGMGWFRIFWSIYVPLSVPALVSAALIMFIFQWQAYLWPLLIAPSNDMKVAAVAIAQFSTAYEVSFGLIFAGALFLSLIPMLIFVFLQQYFTTSVATTGGKE